MRNKDFLTLNKDQILKVQKNRDPYLMIDYASKVVPGSLSNGYKNLKNNEWFSKFIGKMIRICLECCK